jgi:hypothetical protein
MRYRSRCAKQHRLGRETLFRLAAILVVVLSTTFGAGCRPDPDKWSVLRIETAQQDLDADVFVDGHYIGQVSAILRSRNRGIMLAPGVHRLEVRKPGRFPVQKTIRVDGSRSVVVVQAELLTDPT